VIPEKATGEDLLNVKANFCNLKDSRGWVIFTNSLPGAYEQGIFDEWMRIQRENGSTHVVVGDFYAGAYPGSPFQNPDWVSTPSKIHDFIQRILETPSADGKGFRPIIMMDSGSSNPRSRIDRDWPKVIDAIREFLPYVILVPAWEPVQGDWSSADLSYALKKLHDLAPNTYLFWHGSPMRWAGSSNPVEKDDPWQGAEAGFWMSDGGQYLSGMLYQTQHGRIYDDCNPDDDDCWLNRWYDGVIRLGTGYHGWRIVKVVLFETCAYEFFRGQVTTEQCRDMATRGKALADKYGVPIGFGNGLPR
jgi:hypothetical protein